MFEQVPVDMKQYAQWVAWKYEEVHTGKPTKVPYDAKTGRHASVTNPDTWCSFDESVERFKLDGVSGIGFVLAQTDPFFAIDLDDAQGNNEIQAKQIEIFKAFPTYSERSPGGNGLHIIGEGSIPSGRKRSKIEIYSKLRFITVTGDAFQDVPITNCDIQLNALWEQMGKGAMAQLVYSGNTEAKQTDSQVIEMMLKAANGGKVADLMNGYWQNYYPSQSEGDMALINIVAFYTQNRKQIERIFRSSELGKRDKAKRIDYMTWMVNKAFDQMLPPVDIEGLKHRIEVRMQEREEADHMMSMDEEEASEVIFADPNFVPEKSIYTAPPGLLGDIAKYIYDQAPRPVPEIALVGAISLMAGIVGRAYNVSGTGLNQYVLLLAPTGTGKEAIASGIDKLMTSVMKVVPGAINFLGPGEIASNQALLKYMSNTAKSFVSVVGEFGIYLQQMSSPKAPSHISGLKRMLLDIYNKSGANKYLRPSIYSDKEKNTLAVEAPSLTLCGESTPEKFYEALHEGMIADGLLPRFTIIQYNGQRPPLSNNHNGAVISNSLLQRLSTLCAHCIDLNAQNKVIQVQCDSVAEHIFSDFDKYCDNEINKTERETKKHLWNRAHIKALKLASCIAVGIDPYKPTITEDIAQWSLNIITSDATNIIDKFERGEFGLTNDENEQFDDIISIFKDYVIKDMKSLKSYGIDNFKLKVDHIIPYGYLHKRLSQKGSFRRDKMGSSYAIKRALKTLVDRGDVQEVSKKVLMEKYDTSATCYAIAVPESFRL